MDGLSRGPGPRRSSHSAAGLRNEVELSRLKALKMVESYMTILRII